MPIFLLLLAALSARAEYDFPYKDPYYATITAAILKADDRDTSVSSEDIAIRLLPERDAVPFFKNRNHTHVRLWAQKHTRPAPLMILVAGLGGGSNSSYLNFMAYHFHKQGFHVLSFPSAFHWSFALAASKSAYPGITREDARDLYTLMQAAVGKLKQSKYSISKIGLLGASMGALEAGYVASLDKKEKKIGFQRTLLINPPVDVLYGIRKLDELYFEGSKLSAEQLKSLSTRVYDFGYFSLVEGDIKSPYYFADIENRLPLSQTERRFLIGQSLREFLQSLIFTTQQIDDRGILKSPISGWNPSPRMQEAAGYLFQDYIEKFLLPALSEQNGKELKVDDLIGDANLSGIESELRADKNIFLMHNADDFIVNKEHLDYLRSIFGNRMQLYPHGGHVGNIWYPENLAEILAKFQELR
jgi:predicted alpha/beta-fold hydrolase